MADGLADSLGKVVLGSAVGFGLYMFITGLGFGGSGRGRGEGRSDAPSRPKDDQRLSFVMFEPLTVPKPSDDVSKLLRFRLRGEGRDAKSYSLEAMIDRVKEGGRSDIELSSTGAVIHGPWELAKDLVKRAGLTVWLLDASSPPPSPADRPSPVVSGNARGQYGRRPWRMT